MVEISFSRNWNSKLNNDIFSTIRVYDPMKLIYYEKNLNKPFDIVLNYQKIGKAELFKIQVETMAMIPYGMLMLDTGEINITIIRDIFIKFGIKNDDDKVIILWFKRKDDNKIQGNQNEI